MNKPSDKKSPKAILNSNSERQKPAKSKQEEWLIESREAIDAYNRHVQEHGVFGDGLTHF